MWQKIVNIMRFNGMWIVCIIETVINHKNLGNGSIILCHNGVEYTAQALDTLITKLEEQGYEIVPISELIYREDFHMNFEGRQIKN